jgi:NADH pyrophosphatase NudC (nudix superfamily)
MGASFHQSLNPLLGAFKGNLPRVKSLLNLETLSGFALGRSAADRLAQTRALDVALQNDLKILLVKGPEIAMTKDVLGYVKSDEVAASAYLGFFEGHHYAVALSGDVESLVAKHNFELVSLRTVGADLSDLDAGLATSAISLNNWHQTHTHCPRCGAETFVSNSGWTRQCPQDGTEHYPRTDPAIIVAITNREDKLLLARQTVWQPTHFSHVAGFVEPGETLEAAVAREAMEETGIEIDSVTYMGSQPWPFPSSLMLAFVATTDSNHITVDGDEIAEAYWYSRAELISACKAGELRIPARVSVARKLIEHWYGSELPDEWSRP